MDKVCEIRRLCPFNPSGLHSGRLDLAHMAVPLLPSNRDRFATALFVMLKRW